MKILAVGAHPDDIEAGCAGTLLKYAQQGHEIHLLVMTEGQQGGDALIRRDEQIRSAELVKPAWRSKSSLTRPFKRSVASRGCLKRRNSSDFTGVNHQQARPNYGWSSEG